MKNGSWQIGLLLGFLLLINLPFLSKSVHIDDVYFLEVADNIVEHPLDPYYGTVAMIDQDYRVFAQTGKLPNTFEAMSHPPLVPYYIAVANMLGARSRETFLHLWFLVFTLLAGVSIYKLAERFTGSPLLVSLFFISSPIFIINSQNLMTDVPMISLFLSSIWLFIRGWDDDRDGLLLLSGVFAGLAMLTRYVAFILFPLFLVYAWLNRKKLMHVGIAFTPALLLFGLWLLQNLIWHNQLHPIASSVHYAKFYSSGSFGLADFNVKALSDLAGLGGTALFPFCFLLAILPSKKIVGPALLVGILEMAGCSHSSSLIQDYTSLQLMLLLLFFTAGIYLVLRTWMTPVLTTNSSHVRSSDGLFLFAWLLIAVISTIFLLPFGTSRYMLPVLPPLILLLARAVESSYAQGSAFRIAAVTTIGLSFVLSVFLAQGDAVYAQTYKRFSSQIPFTESKRVWYIGEWGFRYYMNQKGYHYLRSDDNSPVRGDLVVRAKLAGLHWMSDKLRARCILVNQISVPNPYPIRILNPDAKAGFYSHAFGLLPFAFSKVPLEEFEIYKVIR